MAYPQHHQIVDLTGASAVPPNSSVVIDNPVKRIPHAIIVELISGDARLVIPEVSILADSIIVTNPSLVTPNESKLLIWHWHTRTR